MSIQEIPQHEWKAFCDSFSRQHQGWLVSLEVLGADLDVVAPYLALEGIMIDTRDGKDVISIAVGKAQNNCLIHVTIALSHIRLQQTKEGAHEALLIHSVSGGTTIMRFRTATLPELVDGVVLE